MKAFDVINLERLSEKVVRRYASRDLSSGISSSFS